MIPLEQIKKGIIEMDWKIVCDGYEALTGQSLHREMKSPDSDYRVVLEQISDLINNLFEEPGYVPSTTILETVEIPKKGKPGRQKKKKKKVGCSRKSKTKTDTVNDEEDDSLNLDSNNITPVKFDQKKPGKSQFITNEPNPDEIERNKARARKTTRIRRKPPRKYQAKCSVCSGKFESNRPSGDIGQTCPNCLRGSKGQFNDA